MCEVGDKFIIEVEETYKTNVFANNIETCTPNDLYRIKGFNSLVFDKKGLDKLEKYDKNAGYDKGLSDAWEAAKKICLSPTNGGIEIDILKNVFKTENFAEMMQGTPQEAIEKLKELEEKQEINVGDVVVVYPNNYKAYVIAVADNGQLTVYDKQRNTFKIHKDKARKTGKHIDLTEIFKALEVEDEDR